MCLLMIYVHCNSKHFIWLKTSQRIIFLKLNYSKIICPVKVSVSTKFTLNVHCMSHIARNPLVTLYVPVKL